MTTHAETRRTWRACATLGVLVLGLASARATYAAEPTAPPATDSAATPDTDDDEDLPFKRSLAPVSDREAWEEPGFRFALGYSFELLGGLQGVPGGQVHRLVLRGGGRLDARWSLLATFDYGFVTGSIEGARYAVTLEPTWHPIDHLALSIGAGAGGFFGITNHRWTGRDSSPQGWDDFGDGTYYDMAAGPYTVPNAHLAMVSCDGNGLTVVARGAWSWVLDDLWAVGLELETRGYWVACEGPTTGYEYETSHGKRQWWPLIGGSLGLVFEWR